MQEASRSWEREGNGVFPEAPKRMQHLDIILGIRILDF